MMDLDMLQLLAVKTGLGIKYLSKEERISMLLVQLNELMNNDIILKGGTALNRGYLYPIKRGRFSEDTDLDFIKHVNIDEKMKDIKKNIKKINEFSVSKPRILHRTLRFECEYVNQIDEKDKIQIEFYVSEKKYNSPPKTILLQSQYIPGTATTFPVYCLEELIGQKLIALHNRKEGKDIYDLFYGLDLPIKNEVLINSLSNLFKHYHIKKDQSKFIQNVQKQLDEMVLNAYYIGNSTNHYIPRNLRPNWPIMIKMVKEKIEKQFQ